jgi:hypothetical protein
MITVLNQSLLDRLITHCFQGNIMIKYVIATVTVMSAVFMLNAQEQPVKPETKKVLLAYEKTPFKTNLIEGMSALLKNDTVAVTIIEHSKTAVIKEDPSKFDAIFISNSGVNSKVRPWITDWLKKNAQYNSKIVLHTTQTSSWKVIADVDAVTSASANDKAKEFAAEYVTLIQKKMAPETDAKTE